MTDVPISKKSPVRRHQPKPPKETAGWVEPLAKEALRTRERKVERFERNQRTITFLLIIVITLQLIIISK